MFVGIRVVTGSFGFRRKPWRFFGGPTGRASLASAAPDASVAVATATQTEARRSVRMSPFVGTLGLRAVPRMGDASERPVRVETTGDERIDGGRDEQQREVRERVVEEHDRVVTRGVPPQLPGEPEEPDAENRGSDGVDAGRAQTRPPA